MQTLDGSWPKVILVANSTFEGKFYFSHASKLVDIPHRGEKNNLFGGIFPHFLNSPPVCKVAMSQLKFAFTGILLSFVSWTKSFCNGYYQYVSSILALPYFYDSYETLFACWHLEGRWVCLRSGFSKNRDVCKNCQKPSHSSSPSNHQKYGRASIL